MSGEPNKKIWIDLDNSPHVPFFKPIKEELLKKGFQVVFTARDCAQTCGLADQFGFQYEQIGRHFGKNKMLKVIGLFVRALQLIPFALREKPALALSHGSRTQLILARLLRIPSVMITDYEFTLEIKSSYVIIPEVVPVDAFKSDKDMIFKYPGIKEDVYVPTFSPDPSILEELGINRNDMIITIRPPATEAHYFNAQSEDLFNAVMNHFGNMDGVRIILLPRSKTQEISNRKVWRELISKGKIIIPDKVVNGLNLIWHSDFVISGGGTMNREAAALGVPVYSIFRGEIGAVDRYLANNRKLILIESPADIQGKISLTKRNPSVETQMGSNKTLESIVSTIISIMDREKGRGGKS